MKYLFFLFLVFTVFFYSCSKDEEVLDDFSKDSGTFIDERDGQRYEWVKIGDQVWMAENLSYHLPVLSPASSGSQTAKHYYVYGYNGTDVNVAKATDNYETYGVLYNWPAAMDGTSSSSANPSGVQGVCPAGWHLPSDDEWKQLAQYVSDQKGPYSKSRDDWYGVGKHLKATGTIEDGDGLWYKDYLNNEGTDDFGFSGLPGGHRTTNGYFDTLGYYGRWWSSTESHSDTAWTRYLYYHYTAFTRNYYGKDSGLSVRCVRN